jgi:hypothetical protein
VRAEGSRPSRLAGDLAAVMLVVAAVGILGVVLSAWTGFPKGTDAYSHLTRLRFVAEHFPRHEWLYAWSAGMPTFETYPELPYLALAPITKTLGAPAALEVFGVLAMTLIGLGLYGTVRTATGSTVAGVVAALAALGSMAIWTWILNGGVYARVLAAGLGACACWATARWLGRGGQVAFAGTAMLLAAAIASHQLIGALFAAGIGIATLAHTGPRRWQRAALLSIATLLLASPAIVPAVTRYGGFAGTFLGLDRPQLTSSLAVLVDPRHIGVAVVPVAVAALMAGGGASIAVLLLLGATALCAAYVFAPTLGIPSRLYYVNGVEPFTMTFLVGLAGSLAGGFALGVTRSRAATRRWRREGATAAAVVLVAANLWLGPVAFLAGQGYPKVEDTSAPSSVEQLARRTLSVDGTDVAHRFLPATASESVWFSYEYAKPQLRDYYLQGVVHPDWLAWANAAVYTPPFLAERFHSALDWFAIDGFSVFDDPNFTGNVADFDRDAALQKVTSSDPPVFRQYAVREPTAIWRATNAPLLIVVGDRDEYDTMARISLERVARPVSLVPIWWDSTVDRIPAELLDRAQAILVEDERFGDRAAAERILSAFAERGGRVVLDAHGATPTLTALWPVEAATDEAIAEWRLRSAAEVRTQDFAPARYDGGPWGAPIGTVLRADARAILEQDGRPLVAERSAGAGSVIWVGGNLFYHAKSYGNDAEADFLVDLFGPVTSAPGTSGIGEQLDPERVRITATDARGAFISASYHPKWTARWSDGSARAVYYAGPGLMYVPLPRGDGTLTLELGRTWLDYAVWVLVLLGLALCASPLLVRRRRG